MLPAARGGLAVGPGLGPPRVRAGGGRGGIPRPHWAERGGQVLALEVDGGTSPSQSGSRVAARGKLGELVTAADCPPRGGGAAGESSLVSVHCGGTGPHGAVHPPGGGGGGFSGRSSDCPSGHASHGHSPGGDPELPG